jgi:flavodoxin
MQKENSVVAAERGKCLIIVHSYHHNNTAKIADVFAEVLHAPVKRIDQVTLAELEDYDLIGFGAGIDSGRHYKELLDLADQLPEVSKKPCFIFSTSGIIGEDKVAKDHSALRQKLVSKGYIVKGEFNCKGFNTNSFLKFFGGMNKGRPNSEDLKNAAEFALNLE